jgi:D-mannonate dehydratase
MRERFPKYDLELTGIGLGGECIKNQLLGLPGRDREIENVCKTIRSIGEAYADGAPSPVVIIDQRTTYWVPKGTHWHPGYEKLSYIHFRNVVGTVPKYREVFPHEGAGSMIRNLKALRELGYDRYIVPNPHFGLIGDSDWAHCSRAWQVGYIRGLMQALGI